MLLIKILFVEFALPPAYSSFAEQFKLHLNKQNYRKVILCTINTVVDGREQIYTMNGEISFGIWIRVESLFPS